MITTVTLNPAIDKIVDISHMELGKVHRIDKQSVSFGGKSINVARILTGLGIKSLGVCYLGKSNLNEIMEMSNKDGLKLKTILVDGLTRTNVKIVEPDQKYRTTDINESGFSIREEELVSMVDLIVEESKKSDYVVLSGSLPNGVPSDFYKKMILELKKFTKVILDADGEELRLAMEAGPYLIKPNNHELEAAAGVEINTEKDIVDVSRFLIKKYSIKYILVSRGEQGSILVGEDIVLSAGILPGPVVSTVGAGDSMLAGMIYGLSKSVDLKEALSYGVAASSIAISTKEHKVIEAKSLHEVCKKVEIVEKKENYND